MPVDEGSLLDKFSDYVVRTPYTAGKCSSPSTCCNLSPSFSNIASTDYSIVISTEISQSLPSM